MRMAEIDYAPGRYITDEGKVWSELRHKYLKTRLDKYGYERITMNGPNGKPITKFIHQLVGMAFVDGYEEGKTIDHINRDITDNRAENLRWATFKEQSQNRVPVIVCQKIAVVVEDRAGNRWDFPTITDASRFIGISFLNTKHHLQRGTWTRTGYKVLPKED